MMHAPGALILAQWWRLLPFSVAVPALSLGTILNGYIARRAGDDQRFCLPTLCAHVTLR